MITSDVTPANAGAHLTARACRGLGPCFRRDDIRGYQRRWSKVLSALVELRDAGRDGKVVGAGGGAGLRVGIALAVAFGEPGIEALEDRLAHMVAVPLRRRIVDGGLGPGAVALDGQRLCAGEAPDVALPVPARVRGLPHLERGARLAQLARKPCAGRGSGRETPAADERPGIEQQRLGDGARLIGHGGIGTARRDRAHLEEGGAEAEIEGLVGLGSGAGGGLGHGRLVIALWTTEVYGRWRERG